ncbi:BPL-N domain-containing protein [Pyrococcus kukulkanii]|uniref:BPL-N domain-containing protein n=1 Tax=Pyrococcus kukulkanii TaxID=1609559 RepID=UPI0035668F4E
MIGIFAGRGAVLWRDVANALEKLGVEYELVNDSLNLEGISTLIIPGGYTYEMWKVLYPQRNAIYEFLDSGGKYIGICAGAYLASDEVILPDYSRVPGLGIADVVNHRHRGSFMTEIEIVDEEFFRELPRKVKVWYQNGPHMELEGRIIAVFDDELAAIARQGNVTLLAVHPEGSLENGVEPSYENLKLLGFLI